MPKSTRTNLPTGALDGRTAIVTGAGRNIGKAIALAFSRAGANVVVNGHRDGKAIAEVVEEIEDGGGKAIAVLADVSEHRDVERMVKTAERAFGKVDIAVSNAAVRPKQRFLEMTNADWHKVFGVNLHSAFYLARAVLPGMLERKWGRIIHICGEDGFAAHLPHRAHAIVSKAAIHALSKALTIEFGGTGITANSVSPGPTDTIRDPSRYPTQWKRERVKRIPLKRLATMDDIAGACLFLAGPKGSFISGQAIHVNGGEHMYY